MNAGIGATWGAGTGEGERTGHGWAVDGGAGVGHVMNAGVEVGAGVRRGAGVEGDCGVGVFVGDGAGGIRVGGVVGTGISAERMMLGPTGARIIDGVRPLGCRTGETARPSASSVTRSMGREDDEMRILRPGWPLITAFQPRPERSRRAKT